MWGIEYGVIWGAGTVVLVLLILAIGLAKEARDDR